MCEADSLGGGVGGLCECDASLLVPWRGGGSGGVAGRGGRCACFTGDLDLRRLASPVGEDGLSALTAGSKISPSSCTSPSSRFEGDERR